MPTPTQSAIIPSLRYKDANAAINWLCDVLGFTRHAVYEGPDHTIAHAELAFGSGMVMLGSESNPGEYARHMIQPAETGGRETVAISLITADAAALYAQALAANAEILLALREMDYGGKAFTVRDAEGHIWSIGEYNPWTQPPSHT